MRILLQFPEGLKNKAKGEAEKLEREGHEVFISSARCFGACDLALEEARTLKVDLLRHYGHAEFQKVKGEAFRIEYVPYPLDVKLTVIKKGLKVLSQYKSIGLLTTVQHVHLIPEIRYILESAGHRIIVEKGGPHPRYPGQVLGCDTLAATKAAKKADCLLYFGGGFFHPLGIDKHIPTFIFDPFSGLIKRLDDELDKIQKRRRGMILACASQTV
ncbi:MAG: diphthamide synthesis protein, partial [Candidatus Anstonellales archaeon]